MWDFITSQEFISSVGLGLDIVGAYLIWKFGLLFTSNKNGSVTMSTEGGKSTIGFILLILGFTLQLISYWV